MYSLVTFIKFISKFLFMRTIDFIKVFSFELNQMIQLTKVTFGVNTAPYLALRTLLELSKYCKGPHPLVSSILKEEIYADDVLSYTHN